VQADVGLADGDKAGGFLVALEETFLQEVVVHTHNADLEGAETAAELGEAALESETENEQPVRVMPITAGLDGLVDRLFADRAEFGADVEVSLLLAGVGFVEALGMQLGRAEAVDAGKHRLLRLVAGLHASRFQVLENHVLEGGKILDALALAGEFLGRDRLVVLERLDREGPGYAQTFLVLKRLVVKRLLLGRLVVCNALEGDVRHLFVDEAVANVVPAQFILFRLS